VIALDKRSGVWALLALLAGIVVAVLTPGGSLFVLAFIALLILSLIDLRVALLATLTLAPLKVLTETEFPPARDLPLDVGQLLLLATLGIWLARSIAERRQLGIAWTPVYIPVILFTLAASLSLWVSLSPTQTYKELIQWIEILALIALTVSLMRQYHPGWIAGVLIAAAAVQALIGVYEFLGGSGAPHLWILDNRYFRAFGSFGQPNPFGAFMGLTLPLAIGAAWGAANEAWSAYRCIHLTPNPSPFARRGESRRRVPPLCVAERGAGGEVRQYSLIALAYLVGTVIIGAGLLVSWSRGAWLGFGAAVLMLILFAPRKRLIGIGLVALIGISVLGGAAAGLLPASLVARISDFSQDLTGVDDARGQVISDANYAVLERLAHWQAAIGMANDSPWLGMGFGNYETAYPRYALLNWPLALGHAHNFYLNLLAETGVVGLSAYLVAWIGVVVMTLRALRRATGFRRGLALGLLGVWTHLAVHSVFDKLYVNNLFLHIGVMLGLIGGLISYEKVYAHGQQAGRQ